MMNLYKKPIAGGIFTLFLLFSLHSDIYSQPDVGLAVDRNLTVVFGDTIGHENATQLVWHPSKRTFVAGEGFNDKWDYDNLGFHSFVFGRYNSIPGRYSAAWGFNNAVNGYGNTSWGLSNFAGVNAEYSTVWGRSNAVYDTLNTVWGIDNSTEERGATAWGNNNRALGEYSTTWGGDNVADGENSTALGIGNFANGDVSVVLGSLNRVEGKNSISTGFGNVVKGASSMVVGVLNDSILHSNQLAATDDTPLFSVGNGNVFTGRSNALSVFGSGKMKVGSGSPLSDIHIIQDDHQSDANGIMFEDTLFDDNWRIFNSGNFCFSFQGSLKACISALDGSYIEDPDEVVVVLKDDVTKSKSNISSLLQKVKIGYSSIQKSEKKLTVDGQKLVQDFPEMGALGRDGEVIGVKYKQLYLLSIAALQEEIKTNETQNSELALLKQEMAVMKKEIRKQKELMDHQSEMILQQQQILTKLLDKK